MRSDRRLHSTSSFPRAVAIADVDADDDLDLAVANELGGNVSVLLNNGKGTFAPSAFHPAGSGPQSVAIGDVDGDGAPDLATAHFNSDDVSVLLNTCEKSPTLGDLNSDGDVDGFDLALLLGQWTGAASYARCPPTHAADVNGDCKINGFDLALLLAHGDEAEPWNASEVGHRPVSVFVQAQLRIRRKM